MATFMGPRCGSDRPQIRRRCVRARHRRVVVAHDPAVAHADDAVAGFGDLVVVRHEQDRLAARVQAPEQLEHLVAAFGVERAGRLVGEQQRRLVGERARDRETLALAAGEHAGRFLGLVGETEQVEQVAGA